MGKACRVVPHLLVRAPESVFSPPKIELNTEVSQAVNAKHPHDRSDPESEGICVQSFADDAVPDIQRNPSKLVAEARQHGQFPGRAQTVPLSLCRGVFPISAPATHPEGCRKRARYQNKGQTLRRPSSRTGTSGGRRGRPVVDRHLSGKLFGEWPRRELKSITHKAGPGKEPPELCQRARHGFKWTRRCERYKHRSRNAVTNLQFDPTEEDWPLGSGPISPAMAAATG